MTEFTLVKSSKSNKYLVFENGIKVKNDIFHDKQDFEKELEAMGIKDYTIVMA